MRANRRRRSDGAGEGSEPGEGSAHDWGDTGDSDSTVESFEVGPAPAGRRRRGARGEGRGSGGGAGRGGPRGRGRAWRWVIPLVLAVLLVLYLFRVPLADYVLPESAQSRLLASAERALAADALTRADGQGARELYAAVLALNPDHEAARAGLARVAARALETAQAALAADDRGTARDRLVLARELGVGQALLAPLEDELRRRDSVEDELDRLLADARAAEAAGRLDGGADSALAHYRRMLDREPGNPVALAGRRSVLDRLLGQAESALMAGDPASAAAAIDRVAAIDPGHAGLPSVRAAMSEWMRAALVEVRGEIEADALDAAGERLTDLRRMRPDAAEVVAEVERLASAWIARGHRHLADGAPEAARLSLLRAQALVERAPGLIELQRALAEHGADADAGSGADPAAAADQAAAALRAAEAAMAAGRWLPPAADNAWQHLREADRLAPGDLAVGRARLAVARQARQCLARLATPADLEPAEPCLAVLVEFDPADPDLPGIRFNLAERWIGIADERIGAGQAAAAARALDAAERVDPGHPDLPAMRRRLEQVGEGGRH